MPQTSDISGKDHLREALRLAAEDGLDAACQTIEAAGDAIVVASAYKDFIQALYREQKNVQQMLDAGRRAIGFALDQADSAKTEEPARLKQIAAMISYNIGANTWPGWGDAVDISADQRHAGREMAALSLRLVQELKLGPPKLGGRHWLIGAHHIAERRLEPALAALEAAARAFAEAGDRPSEMMTRGYCALARKLSPNQRPAAQMELDEVLRRLGQEASKSAVFYRDQIMMADRILCPGS